MASTRMAIFCVALALTFGAGDAATLSAAKQFLPKSDAEIPVEDAPLPAMSWEDNELDQPMHDGHDLNYIDMQHMLHSKAGVKAPGIMMQVDETIVPLGQKAKEQTAKDKTAETPAETAIVKAKVKEVRALIDSHKKEYNDPQTTEQRKDALFMETLQLSRKHMGTPGYNYEECLDLWQNTDQESIRKTFYDCPALNFPDANKFTKNLQEIQDSQPSPLRSAYLSELFWTAMLKNDIEGVKSMLSPNVTMYEENRVVATGANQVAMKAPQIGYPRDADTSSPEEWTCDSLGCIVPLKSWSQKACPVMAKFDAEGKVQFLTANLFCWR